MGEQSPAHSTARLGRPPGEQEINGFSINRCANCIGMGLCSDCVTRLQRGRMKQHRRWRRRGRRIKSRMERGA